MDGPTGAHPQGDQPDPGPPPPPGAGRTFLERRGISPAMFGTFCVLLFFMLYQVVGTVVSLIIFGPDFSSLTPAVFRVIV